MTLAQIISLWDNSSRSDCWVKGTSIPSVYSTKPPVLGKPLCWHMCVCVWGGLILALSCQGAHAAPIRLPQHKFHFGARRPVHSGTQDMFVGWVGGRMSGGVDGERRDGHTNKPMMKFKTDPSTASFRELCVKIYTDSPAFGCQGHRG